MGFHTFKSTTHLRQYCVMYNIICLQEQYSFNQFLLLKKTNYNFHNMFTTKFQQQLMQQFPTKIVLVKIKYIASKAVMMLHIYIRIFSLDFFETGILSRFPSVFLTRLSFSPAVDTYYSSHVLHPCTHYGTTSKK